MWNLFETNQILASSQLTSVRPPSNNSFRWTPQSELASSDEIVNQWQPTTKGQTAQIWKGRLRILVCTPAQKTATFRKALFTWKSPQPTGDYYHQINQYNRVRWAKQKLFPAPLPYCVVVFDKASHHNVKLNCHLKGHKNINELVSASNNSLRRWYAQTNTTCPCNTFRYQWIHDSHCLANQTDRCCMCVLLNKKIHTLLSQVYCVWQVVKTPTIISNKSV